MLAFNKNFFNKNSNVVFSLIEFAGGHGPVVVAVNMLIRRFVYFRTFSLTLKFLIG